MNKFQSTEIKSKTLDQFTNNEPEPTKLEEAANVVNLPQIESAEEEPEIDEKEDLDEDTIKYQEPELFDSSPNGEGDECQCVPGIGKISKKKVESQTENTAKPGLFANKTYILYGLMALGLASKLLS